MINGGWSVYAPAECLVLLSRLHLVNQNEGLRRWLLLMILIGSFLVIVPNWVFVFPAYNPNSSVSSVWSPRMAIIDRISQAVFTFFELVINSIYIHSLLGILRTKINVRTRRVMRDLVCVNVTVITMDLIVIILIFLNQANLAYPFQDFTYAFKFKIEFAVLNQLMAVATHGSRSRRRRSATFENRRYQRPGTTLMLNGYSDDNISGVRLPFLSTTDEATLQQNHNPWRQDSKQRPQAIVVNDGQKPKAVEEPPRILLSAKHDSEENVAMRNYAAESEKVYDMDFAFSGPSLEFSSSTPSSRQGESLMLGSLRGKDSDDTLLAPVADDHVEETLADPPQASPLQQPQSRQRGHQYYSLRRMLFGRRKTPQVPNHGYCMPNATFTAGPLVAYSPPETIGQLAGSNAPSPSHRSRWKKNQEPTDERQGNESDSEDEGIHTWERRRKVAQEVPWFQKADRPGVHRSKTT